MSQRDTIYKLFNMQAGEGKVVALFVLYSLFMGMAVAVFYTCTTALFLTNFSRTQMPLAFIAGGLTVYGLGVAVQALQRRISLVRLNGYLLGFLVVSVACLLLVPERGQNKWVYFLLFLWNRVFVFINGITFWATASRIFNFQQAKRLFSFISMGDVISAVLSYFAVPVLLSFSSTETLLLVSLIALLICTALILVITNRYHQQLTADPVAQPGRAETTPEEANTHRRYYVLLYLLALLPVFGLVYVEFMFTVELKEVFPNKELLASFLAIFFGMCSVIELGIKAFLYTRLMSTYSVRIGVVMLPLALFLSYTLTAVYGSIYGVTSLLLAFVALSRFFMSSIRRAISEPVFQVLFQPIPTAERTKLQSRIEGGPKALGNIAAGVLLLILANLPFVTMVHLSYVFLIIVGFWAVVSFRLQAAYNTLLSEVVGRWVSPGRSTASVGSSAPALILPDKAGLSSNQSFDAMVRLARSADPADRIRAATELGYSGRYYAYQYLLALLQDEHPAVRHSALLAAGALRKPELWQSLFNHLTLDAYRDTATSAVLTIGKPIVPGLIRSFHQMKHSPQTRVYLIGLINDIGGDTALRFLRTRMNHPVQAIRDKVFEGLRGLRHKATVTERPHVLVQLDEQIALLVWLGAARLDLTSYPKESPLMQALRHEKQLVVPKVFNLLATLCGDDRFDTVSELITQKNNEIKGYLIELLSASLPNEVKNRVLPLFSDTSLEEKVRRSAVNYPQQRLSVEARLHDIINKDFNKLTPWVKAVAIWELLNWHQTDPTTILVASSASPDELIAETAFYVLNVLNPERFTELRETLCLYPDSLQCRISEFVAGDPAEETLRISQSDRAYA